MLNNVEGVLTLAGYRMKPPYVVIIVTGGVERLESAHNMWEFAAKSYNVAYARGSTVKLYGKSDKGVYVLLNDSTETPNTPQN